MNVSQISIDRGKAALEYNEYREAIKKNKSAEYLIDLKNAYGHLKRGHPILDVWQAFKETGLDEKTNPKIAISPANAAEVRLFKFGRDRDRWSGVFCPGLDGHGGQRWRDHRSEATAIKSGDVFIPKDSLDWTFGPVIQAEPWRNSAPLGGTDFRTKVPIIPARFVPSFGLSNYHILWEVEKWDVVTPPRDPLLLKRISPNIFTVLAAWELTDLERAVLRGRIA